MRLCYNKIMKTFLKIFIIFFFLISPAKAITFDVLVLPADIFQTKENYYNFEEVSEIVSNDLIKNFNKSNGKIKSPDLYMVKAQFEQNQNAKQMLQNAMNKYKNSNSIDYSAFKEISNLFNCKSVILVSSSVMTNKNSLKRSLWEILEISSTFDITYPYRLETSVVLLDTVNNVVMWSNNYSTKIGANDNIFAAKNFAQANGEYEKIKLYSQTVVAPSASQNIMLRFFPKSIKPYETKVEDTGGALRYDARTLPEKPRPKNDDVPYTGDMLFEF